MNNNVQTLNQMTEDASSQLKMLKDATEILIQDGYGVNLNIMQKVKGLTDEDIDDFQDDELDSLLIDADGQAVDFTEKLEKRNETARDVDNMTLLGYKRFVLKDICKNVRDLDEAASAIGDIINDKNALMKEYVESILTKSTERYNSRIEQLTKVLEKAATEDERVKIQKIIDVFTNLNSLNYIFKDINLYNKKELDIIVTNFLESKKAEYMVQKFLTKCKQMKINSEFYKIFLNAEEMFLEEEYQPFNNLFLFFTMRFIAYGNPYNATDKSYALNMIMALHKLLTNKYKGEEKEQFLMVMRKFLDYFKPYLERFKKENATYKYHPIRLEHDKVLAEKMDAENMAKGKLPIDGDGEYSKGEHQYKAWYNGVCEDCGATLRWTNEAGAKEFRVQCMGPNCINHLFTDMNNEEVPDYYEVEKPLLDDDGNEITFPTETIEAVTEIIPEKLGEIVNTLTDEDIEKTKAQVTLEENDRVSGEIPMKHYIQPEREE